MFVEPEKLQERIDYRFTDAALLMQALTHSSFANEVQTGLYSDYERLEFLGDAVLEMVTSTFLYAHFPAMTEGELTKKRASLVCEPALHAKAMQIDLPTYIRLGKGEEKSGGRDRASIIADVTEALIGAIYLDGGFAAAEYFIDRFILSDAVETDLTRDYKSALQEYAQAHDQTLEYRLLDEYGPAHDRIFRTAVCLDGTTWGEGEGRSKKTAQQNAAKEAMKRLTCI